MAGRRRGQQRRLRNAVQTLSVSASPNILFVDLSESAIRSTTSTPLPKCANRNGRDRGRPVNDVRLYRDLVASGIQIIS
jgi:pilus assembly protein CpaE